jgi:CheY-like chemotaxis protein
VRLPLARSSQALAPRLRTREIEPQRPESSNRDPRSIVTAVIDDNDDARELVSDLLRRRGYEVITASDGPQGLRLLAEHRPDIALVDLGLPGIDGIGVAEALRDQQPGLRTRLVALTGYGDSAIRERTVRAGFHAHLVKPASAAAIFACIATQLEEAAGRPPDRPENHVGA